MIAHLSRRGMFRASAVYIAEAVIGLGASNSAFAADAVRLAVPTKTYWSSVVIAAAQEKGLFAKAGLKPEVIISKNSADAFSAVVAGAADICMGPPSLAAMGLQRGASVKVVGIPNIRPYAWHVAVLKNSPIKTLADLDGKRVGIAATGTLFHMLGQWAAAKASVNVTYVPFGAAGVGPYLSAGNVDAVVISSPVSLKMLSSGEVRSILSFADEMEPSAIDTWMSSQRFIESKPEVLKKTLHVLSDALNLLQTDPKYAVDLIARNSELSPAVAELEYKTSFANLITDFKVDNRLVDRYLDLAKYIGLTTPPNATTLTNASFAPAAAK